MGDRNSWVKNYDQVEFTLPFLADVDSSTPMPIPPSAPATPPKTPPAVPFPRSFASSPLNPSAPSAPSVPSSLSSTSRPNSSGRMIPRMPSDERRAFSQPLAPGLSNPPQSRGSMILYRYADMSTSSSEPTSEMLVPPNPPHALRASMYSTSTADSVSSDTKYPLSSYFTDRGLIAYAYDPEMDENDPPDEEDRMHDPNQRYHHELKKGKGGTGVNIRALINITTIVAMVLALLCLFVGYPIIAFVRDNGRSELITFNTKVNSSGQFPADDFSPGDTTIPKSLAGFVDRSTPPGAFSFVGTNDLTYNLIFSDEFNYTGGTYNSNDNLYWVARDSGLSSPDAVTTQNGQLFYNIVPTTSGQYLSAIIDSAVPFCVGRGFIVVGVQEQDGSESRFYWAGSWQFTNAAPDNFVPAGPSLNADLSFTLAIGAFTNTIPRGTPSDQVPTSVTVDYVRYYEREVDSGDVTGGCDLRRATKKTATLDLLNPPQ